MESPAEPPSKVSHKTRSVAVVIIITVAVAAVGSAYSLGLFNQSNTWPFKGAYVEYSGKATFTSFSGTGALSSSESIGVRLEVIDLNSTAAEYLQSSSVGGTTNKTTYWQELNVHHLGWTFITQNNASRYINGNTYSVIAEEYRMGNSTSIFYYSGSTASWYVEDVLTSAVPQFSIDLILNSTNIPGQLVPQH